MFGSKTILVLVEYVVYVEEIFIWLHTIFSRIFEFGGRMLIGL